MIADLWMSLMSVGDREWKYASYHRVYLSNKILLLKYLEVNKVGCMDRLVKYMFLVSEVITFRNQAAYNET